MDLNKANIDNADDIQDVNQWIDEIYASWFGPYFDEAREHFKRLKSNSQPITDGELTWIMVQLPIQLFSISEDLNKFKVHREIVKLKNKQKEHELKSQSTETTATKKAESAELAMVENKILAVAYDTTVQRVETEIAFCRELIMSAKKIWDSRRYTDSVNPIKEMPEPNLPDYQPAYIR